MEINGQSHAPAGLLLYQLSRKLVGPKEPVLTLGKVINLLPLPEYDPRTVHFLAKLLCSLRYIRCNTKERYRLKQMYCEMLNMSWNWIVARTFVC